MVRVHFGGVQRLMTMTGLFPELGSARRANGVLRVLHERDGRTIFLHLHFSNYGKFEQQLQAEAREISALIAQRDVYSLTAPSASTGPGSRISSG